MKKFKVAALLLCSMLYLSCGDDHEAPTIFGKWKTHSISTEVFENGILKSTEFRIVENENYIFNTDATFTNTAVESLHTVVKRGTYTLNYRNLYLTYEGQSEPISNSYEITDNDRLEFVCQEVIQEEEVSYVKRTTITCVRS